MYTNTNTNTTTTTTIRCMVYPTQIITPILENMDMVLASSTPVGKLDLSIEKAQMKVKKSRLELSKPDYFCEVCH